MDLKHITALVALTNLLTKMYEMFAPATEALDEILLAAYASIAEMLIFSMFGK